MPQLAKTCIIIFNIFALFGMATRMALAVGPVSGTSTQEIFLACTSFPPYKIANNPALPGIDVEIIEEALSMINVRLKRRYIPWKRSWENMLSGQNDGVCGCSWRKEREEVVLFSSPTSQNVTGYFYRRDDPRRIAPNAEPGRIAPNADPGPLRIGVVRGYSLEAELTDKGWKYYTANDERQLARLLAGNRIDAAYSFREPVLWHARSLVPKPDFVFQEIRAAPNHVCFSKKSEKAQKLLPAFNKALEKLHQSGRSDEIRAKYR